MTMIQKMEEVETSNFLIPETFSSTSRASESAFQAQWCPASCWCSTLHLEWSHRQLQPQTLSVRIPHLSQSWSVSTLHQMLQRKLKA